MKFDPTTMSPAAFRADLSKLAQLFAEARDGEVASPRIKRVHRLLEHLATSPSFSFAFLIALLSTILLSVAGALPTAALPILLCYPFGLALIICSMDAVLAWQDRRLLKSAWMALWAVLLLVINSTLVAVAVS